jgi:bifunctional non-homologous end joining protein LigD
MKHKVFGNKSLMPHLTPPMLAEEGFNYFNDADYAYEIKCEGFRCMAELNKNKVLIYSKNLKSFNLKFPSIVQELAKLNLKVILDGIIVALDENGGIDAETLMSQKNIDPQWLWYYVFDVLWYEERSLLNVPWLERKELLKSIIPSETCIRYNEHFEVSGEAFFKQVTGTMKIQGIVGKRKDGIYLPGKRTSQWIKYKNKFTDEVWLIGYVESGSSFSGLLYGELENGKLIYKGRAERGFKDTEKLQIFKMLKRMKVNKKPVLNDVTHLEGVCWVKPVLKIVISIDRVITGLPKAGNAAAFLKIK